MRSTVFGNRPRLDSVELLEIPAPTSVFTSIVESGRRWAPLVTAFSKVSAADLAERLDELTQLRQAHALCDFAVTSQPDSERPLRQFGFTEVRVLGRDDLLAPSCPHGLRVADRRRG